jgi:hypothetical protein
LETLSLERVEIVLRESVGLIANALEKSQRGIATFELDRFRLARSINLLVSFRQGYETRRFDLKQMKHVKGRVKLAFSAVNKNQVRENLVLILQAAKTAADDFPNRCKVIDTLDGSDLESPVSRLEWNAVDKGHQGGNRMIAPVMSDVDAFDHSRRFR